MMSEDPTRLPADPNRLPEKSQPPPPKASPHLYHEARVVTYEEIATGRAIVLWSSVFMVVMAIAAPAQDFARNDWGMLPAHVVRLLISVVVIIGLIRSIPKIRYFAAMILAVAAILSTGLLLLGISAGDFPLSFSSLVCVIGYSIIASLLANSPYVRRYLGYLRARKRRKREARERKNLHRIVDYQAKRVAGNKRYSGERKRKIPDQSAPSETTESPNVIDVPVNTPAQASQTSPTDNPFDDYDLAFLVHKWGSLPENVRRGILAMIQAVDDSDAQE